MPASESEKKSNFRRLAVISAVFVVLGGGIWVVYERFLYVDPDIKESLEFWDNFNKETKK